MWVTNAPNYWATINNPSILFCKASKLIIYDNNTAEVLIDDAFMMDGTRKQNIICLFTEMSLPGFREVDLRVVMDYIMGDNKLIKYNSI